MKIVCGLTCMGRKYINTFHFLSLKGKTAIRMEALSVAIVVAGFVMLTTASDSFVNCRDGPDNHLAQCEFGSICAWNKCHCGQGRKGCSLICTSNMKQWCNGLSEGDRCFASQSAWECVKFGRKLMCLQNPLSPVCIRMDAAYGVGEGYTAANGTFCPCVPRGVFDCNV